MSEHPRAGERFVTTRSKSARCAPEAILGLVKRPATWPDWQQEILSTEGPNVLEAGDVATGQASMLGFNVRGQAVAQRSTERAFSHFVVVGVGMTVSYEVEETSAGVEVTHRIESDLPTGLLGTLLSFFLKRRLRRMQSKLIDALVIQAEG